MIIPDMAKRPNCNFDRGKGPNLSVVTACATGTSFHRRSVPHRRARGQADVIAGPEGVEAAICPLGLAGFVAARALSRRNDERRTASRPFDKTREWLRDGEGAGIFNCDKFRACSKAPCPIYGEIIGYGASGDASPHYLTGTRGGEGAQRAMREALKDGKLAADQSRIILTPTVLLRNTMTCMKQRP